jgi:hypothetical protein
MTPEDRLAKMRRVAQVAAELGTREAARRLGISRNTVTTYVALTQGAVPSILSLRLTRTAIDGRVGQFAAHATGYVTRHAGRARRSVRFTVSANGHTFDEALARVLERIRVEAKTRSQPPDRRLARRRETP